METLNLQPLARAITRLDEGWQRYLREQADEQIRDGLIQRFEFTYEISHKTLKRYLLFKTLSARRMKKVCGQGIGTTGNNIGKCEAAPAILMTRLPRWQWSAALKNF